MVVAFWPRDLAFIARSVPAITTFFFALLSLVPFHLPAFGAVAPSFVLMAVFHWTIYRPELLPLSAVFLIGVLLDLLNGTIYVGLTALMLLLARTVLLGHRRFFIPRPFPILWLGFLALAAGAALFEWAFVSLLQATWLEPRSFILQTLITAACFPIGSYLLALAHRAVPNPGG